MPKVSIVIPAYNVGPWIEETLKSVQQQTFKDFECIVVDDKSTDKTCAVVNCFIGKDRRFKLILRDHNEGQGACRNVGIWLAQGEYIAFLDSDDLWHPTFLERMLQLIESKGAWLAYSHFAMFHDGTSIRKPLAWDNLLRTKNIWWDMLLMTEFHLCSCLGSSELVRKSGGFDSRMRTGQDRDFLLRLLAMICEKHPEKVCGTEEELFFYRQRESSTIYTRQRQAIAIEWNFMPRYLDHPGVPAAVRRRGYSFLAFKMGVISLNLKDYAGAIRWFIKSVCYDPLNINLFWLPLRKIWYKIKSEENIEFLDK